MQRLVQRLILAAAVLVLPGSAAAISFSLEELIDDQLSIQVGDKVFSDFDYEWNGDMPSASEVIVADLVDQDGNFGISFLGGFLDFPDESSSVAVIRYTVTSLGARIDGAHLAADPVAPGGGVILVNETFGEVGPPSLLVFADGDAMKFLDWRSFEPTQESLRVTKEIVGNATGDRFVEVSVIDQSFSQVPEPGTALLLGIGLSGLAFAGRQRDH